MKLFIATLGTETNTFSPFVTSAQTFEETYLTRGGGHGDTPNTFAVPLVLWRQRAEALGWEVGESLCAFAMPSGVTLRALYRQYKEEILADLRAALPVDAVLLCIHGAMVVEGFDRPLDETDGIDCADAEGDLFEAVRAVIGPDVPFGAELDLHCHLTEKKVRNTDALVLYKEYPHTDFPERAEDVFEIIKATVEGKVRPVQSLHDCGAVGVFHTTREPMRSFVDHMIALEGDESVLSVSLGHSFPWADVPELGVRSLVVTDNQQAKGDAIAADLCRRLNEIYDEAQPPYLTLEEGLDQAIALAAGPGQGPVVLADVADNAGGGAPNDSTFVLRRVLERGIGDIAFANFWDPIAVQLAISAGEGATFDLRLGGKMGPMSGDPIDLRVTVKKIVRDARQTFGKPPRTSKGRMGDAVSLQLENGVEIGINSLRTQSTNPDALTQIGIDAPNKRFIVVKSMQHFHAGYAPIAKAILYVAAPGTMVPYFEQLPYRIANRSLRGIDG
jgi:microcystin degradation protein MlrC